ncbi:hypothetical protein ACFQ6Q_00835 [Streptomyces sp. NPDC056437]|uniref:hypothetical protein n=1 Tax=Streptomyces sp. NPDC056437 TaxID=3345816 RepID=UPI00369905FD
MQVKFTDQDITAKAVELGLIQDGQALPRDQRSKVVAVLLEQAAAASPKKAEREPQIAKEIVIQPDGVILVDGEEFPWLVAKEAMDIRLDPEGFSTVRLTLVTNAVQIIKPEPRQESEQPR